jgi:hypothetical protein
MICRTDALAVTRRAEALDCQYEARLRGLDQATGVAFAAIARRLTGRAGAESGLTA